MTTTNEQLTTRQQLCELLCNAGCRRNAAEVATLLKLISNIDQELEVPEFDLPVDVPQAGDLIYAPTSMSIDHGEDDVRGGVGVVKEVKVEHYGTFVETHEQPDRAFNWEYLAEEQARLKEDYGDEWARPDPDLG